MKIGVYYIGQPVEWEDIFLSEGQRSVWQWKTEIPRNSGKGCGKEAAPFFYAMTRTKPGGFVKIETGLKRHGVLEEFDCRFRVSDFGFTTITCK